MGLLAQPGQARVGVRFSEMVLERLLSRQHPDKAENGGVDLPPQAGG